MCCSVRYYLGSTPRQSLAPLWAHIEIQITTMERRKFIQGAVGIGAAASVAGVGIGTLAGGAAANVNINPTNVSHTSVDGTVDAVLLNASGSITWEGLDSSVTGIDFELAIKPVNDSNYETVDQTTVSEWNGQQGTKTSSSNGANFSFSQIDLTETSKFDDSDFEETEDGETEPTPVDIRVSVTLNTTGDDFSPDPTSNTLEVSVTNQEASASTNTDVGASVSFAGDINDKNGNDTGDDAYLEFDFSSFEEDGTITIYQHLDNYLSKLDGGAGTEAPLNAPVAFDANMDGTRDFQIGWLPGLDEPELAYKNENGSNTWQEATQANAIQDAKVVGSTIEWVVTAPSIAPSSSGGNFRVGGNATAGGEAPSVAFKDNGSGSAFEPSDMYVVTIQ